MTQLSDELGRIQGVRVKANKMSKHTILVWGTALQNLAYRCMTDMLVAIDHCKQDSYSHKPITQKLCCRASFRHTGLVIKASTSGVEDLGFESLLRRDFSASSHTNDLKIGTPVATLPGAWYYRVNAGTGRPGVSILWLGEVESLICNFYLSVAAHKIVCADASQRYTSMLLGC